MKNKTIITIVLVILVLTGLLLFMSLNNMNNAKQKPAEKTIAMKSTEVIPVTPTAPPDTESMGITASELSIHNSRSDCWVVYEGKVYDITNPPTHPNMGETFFMHCGKTSGFEEGAKARHSGSSQTRVERYATYVGDLKL